MKEWFNNLAEREQRLISVMVGVVIIAAFYFMLVKPLQERVVKAEQGVTRNQQLLTWVEKKCCENCAIACARRPYFQRQWLN